AGGVLRRVLRSRGVYAGAIQACTASGAAMGNAAASACGTIEPDGRRATGGAIEGRELRSPGAGEQKRHCGAGEIGYGGDAVARMGFSFGAEAICAGAGVD